MPAPKRQIDYEQQIQINDLAKDIEVIKDNHLAHMAQDIDEVKYELKDQKEHFNRRLDKLDNRIWWIMGIAVTTLLGIVAQNLV